MKVLHFKTKYLNPSETFINRLVRNHQIFEPIIATCYKKSYSENLTVYEMPHEGFDGMVNTIQLKLNSSPNFLFDVVEKEKPDIIHGHFGLDSYRLIRLCKKTNIPLIVTFYGHDVSRLPREIRWKTRYKRMKNYIDWAISVSEDMKGNLAGLGFDSSWISTIKLAVDTNSIKFVHRKQARPKLMMVGRCVEKKGFIYGLEAIKKIKKMIPDITLDVYGDGTELSLLKEFTRKNDLQKQVTFHGFTPNNKVFEALYNHDILMVPSVQAKDGDREGMPQTTVEGMATGIPVIAADHAGLPELVKNEETGILVPERNPDAITKAICKLVNHPELVQTLSTTGRKKIETDHNVNKQVEQTENLYKYLINSHE